MLSFVVDENEILVQGQYKSTELMSSQAHFEKCLSGLTAPKDLNLAKVEGSDSGLIALLLSFQRFANEKQWQVKLINPSDGVKGLIELSQLNEFFTLVDESAS